MTREGLLLGSWEGRLGTYYLFKYLLQHWAFSAKCTHIHFTKKILRNPKKNITNIKFPHCPETGDVQNLFPSGLSI